MHTTPTQASSKMKTGKSANRCHQLWWRVPFLNELSRCPACFCLPSTGLKDPWPRSPTPRNFYPFIIPESSSRAKQMLNHWTTLSTWKTPFHFKQPRVCVYRPHHLLTEILLPLLLECWDYRCGSPHPAQRTAAKNRLSPSIMQVSGCWI